MWLFLASLKLAVNLAHYVRAQLTDDGSLVLYKDTNDRVHVKDPADVARLKQVFSGHALLPLETVTAELVDEGKQPAPAEAATDVSSSVTIVDGPAANSEQPQTAETATVQTDDPADAAPDPKPTALPSDKPAKTDELPKSDEPAPATEEQPVVEKPVEEQPADSKPASPPFLKRR